MKLDFSGITLPFTPADLLSAGVALLGVVGLFVLLGLSFKVVPKLVSLIVNAFNAGGGRRA
ncbi:hypothetical protein ACQQ6W_23280 [Lysinibacillus fusiformis]